MSKRKPQKTPFDVAGFIKSSERDVSGAVSSLLESKASARQSQPAPTAAEPLKDAAMSAIQPAVRIRGVRALSQTGQPQSVFVFDQDALKLVIDLTAAHDLVNSDARFHADFQLVDFATGRVAVDRWSANLRLEWGHEFWISLGNNKGPDPSDYTTPAKWGLTPGLYIFRSLVEYGRTIVYAPAAEIAIRISGGR
jgi:hypothetical protein